VSQKKEQEERDAMAEAAEKKRDYDILNAKPLITTDKWNLERMQLHNAPVGLAQNPVQPVHSLGNEQYFSYNGQWKLGRMHGFGTYMFQDKYTCKGQWEDNRQHGTAVSVYPEGQIYDGEWVKGRYEGQGTFSSVCGSSYVGGYEFGRRHGHGKLTFPSGMVYEGDFFDGEGLLLKYVCMHVM